MWASPFCVGRGVFCGWIHLEFCADVAVNPPAGDIRSRAAGASDRESQILKRRETKTGSGTFVIASAPETGLHIGDYSSQDLHEARPHIEVPAAELAATRRTEANLVRLHVVTAVPVGIACSKAPSPNSAEP